MLSLRQPFRNLTINPLRNRALPTPFTQPPHLQPLEAVTDGQLPLRALLIGGLEVMELAELDGPALTLLRGSLLGVVR